MTPLFFHCMACGDSQAVAQIRRHCLCGRSSARSYDDTVIVAGPGRVSSVASVTQDRDDALVMRPAVAVGH